MALTFVLTFMSIVFNNLKAQTCTINAGDLTFTICEGSPFNFTGQSLAPPDQITWTQISGPSVVIQDVNDAKSGVIGMVGGNTYVFSFSANCTALTQEVTVNVESLTAADAGLDVEFCPDAMGNVIVTGNSPLNAGETGSWVITGANDAGVTIDFPTSETTTLTMPATSCGTTTLSWIIEGEEYAPGQRCRSQSDILITNYGGVNPVDAGFDQTLGNCYTTTTSTLLDATFGGCSLNGQVGGWSFVSGPNIPSFTDVNNADTRVSRLIEGTYVLRWSVGGPCSTADDEVTITVPAATQDVTGVNGPRLNYFICDTGISSITFDGRRPEFAGETVSWTQIGGTMLPSGSIASPTSPTTVINNLTSPGDPYTFRYQLINSTTGCTSFRDYRVEFRGSSRSVEVTTNGGNNILGACGQTVFDIQLNNTGSGFTNYQIVSGPAGSPLGPFPTTSTFAGGAINVDLSTEGTYVFEFVRTEGGELPLGCTDGFDTINVTVSSNNNTPNAGLDFSEACGSASTNLIGNVPTAGTPIWSQISGPSTVTFADPFQSTATANGLIAGTYEFQYTFQGGGTACPVTPDTVTVNISDGSLSTSSTGPGQSVCFNAPAYMNASTPAAGEIGTWTQDPGNPNPVTFSDINDPNAIVTGLTAPSSAYTFTWTIDYSSAGPSGCATPAGNDIIITTLATETPTVANAGPDGCFPSGTTSINLGGNITAGSGETGTWTVAPSSGVTFAPNANAPNATVTIPGDGAYTFTWTISDDTGTCGNTMDDTEVVVAEAATGIAAPDQSICASSTVMTATLSSGAVGEWSYISGPGGFSFSDINDPAATVNFMANGTYVFEWTITAGSCSTDSDRVTIEVGIPPTPASAGADQNICNATNIVMGGSSYDTNTEIGTWSLLAGAPNNPNIGDSSNPNTNISGLITGTYTFRWTVTGIANPLCPPSFDDVIVEVYAPANAGANQNLCNVTSISLEGTENSTGTWTLVTGPGGATITQSPANGPIANVDLSATPAGTYVFQYETDAHTFASGGNCPSQTDTVQVIVSATPSFDPLAGPDQDICNADTTTVTMAGNTPPGDGTTAEWVITFPTGSSATVDTPSSPTSTISGLNTPGIYVIEWTFTNGNCVKLADVVRVEVFAPPAPINAGPDQPNACELDFMTSATFPTTGLGTWTITNAPAGSSTTIDSPNNPITSMSNIAVGTYELTWTVSNGPFSNPSLCAPRPDVVEIIFNDVPPSDAEAGPDQVLCDATQVNLGATPVTSGEGTWTLVSGPNTPTITSANNPNSLILGLVTGTYEFRWRTATVGDNGCSFEDTVTIEVVSDPLASEAGPDKCIAEFSPLVLEATPAAAGTGTWSQISGPTTVGFINASDPTTSVTGAAVGSYVFEWTVDNGTCTPVKDQVTICVQANADLELTKAVAPSSVNVGDTVTFTISIFNDNTATTNADATGVSVEDIIPAGYDLVPGTVSNGGVFNAGNKSIDWSSLNVPNGTTLNLTYSVIVNATGPYLNSAQITGSDQFDPDSDPTTDSTVDEDGDGDPDDDDEDTAQVTIESADLSLSKTVNPISVSVGDPVTFTINLTNIGANTATNVEVVDQLPNGYTYVSDNSGGNYNPVSGLWTVGNVTIAGTSLVIQATVNAPTGVTDEYINTAQITASDQADPDSTINNDDGDQSEDDEDNTVITLENADLELMKSVNPVTGAVGDLVTFTIDVANLTSATSTGNATGVDIQDVLPAGYTLVSGSISNGGLYDFGSGVITWTGLSIANGSSIALTFNATVNASGPYLNIAQVTGADLSDPDTTNNNDDATFTIAANIPPIAVDNVNLGNNPGTIVVLNIVTNDTDSDGAIDPSSVNLIAPTGTFMGSPIVVTDVITNLNGDIIGFTVEGQGVWSYDEVTGEVSFDPESGYTADPTAITYTIDDDDGASSNVATITVGYQSQAPVADNDQDLNNDLGTDVTISVLGNDLLADGNTPRTSDITFTFITPGAVVAGFNIILTVAGEGVWTYDTLTGDLTFSPEATFEGDPTPIEYTITDIDNRRPSNIATVTITYEDRPVAVDDTSSGNTPGTTVTLDIVGNDTDGDGNLDPTTVSLTAPVGATNIVTSTDGDVIGFEVPGEGVWSYDETTGEISFDPIAGFTGDPTDIEYTIFDADGNESTDPANINIEYLDTAPVAENDVNPVPTDIGDSTVINLLTNDLLGDGTTPNVSDVTVDLDPSTPGVQTTLTVIGEGVWAYDLATGNTTFTPEIGFEVSPTPIIYELVDLDTGASDTATITVVYEIPPKADNDSTSGNTQGDTVSVNILAGDIDADGTIDPASVNLVVPTGATNQITDLNGDIIGFTVPGEGVWMYNEITGELSFDPEVGFTGNPTPIAYTVDDNDGNTSNVATVTVEYDQDPPVANDNTSTGNDTGNPVAINVLANDMLADGSTPNTDDIIFNLVVPTGAASPIIGTSGNTIGFTVSDEGVWIYDEATGEITFIPEAGFTSDPTPIDYNLTDVDTGEVTVSPATITIDYEIELPVSENDESLNNSTGSTANVNILANDSDPDGDLDLNSVNLITPADATAIVTDADGDVIGFTVPGEGVWLYNPATGELEFTPEAGFVLDPTPIEYTVDDNDGNTSNPSAVTIDYIDVADLSLTKIVVDNDIIPLVGSEITFKVEVFNDGPQNATGVKVKDLLPNGYDFVLFSSTVGSYDETTGIWTVGNIASGVSETLLIDVLVNTTGIYKNDAQVTSSDVFDIDSTPNNDDGDQSEDDEASAFVTPVISTSDLSLTKIVVDNDITPLVGSEITFQLTIFNDGPENATGVEVKDLLPDGYDFVLFSSTVGSYNETTGVWTVGNIASGVSETLLIDALVNPTGDYRNLAQVTASDIVDVDSTPSNMGANPVEDDEAEASVTPVISIADLSITKTVVDGDITPLVGDEITFQITIRNDGPVTATGVAVTDLLPSGYDFLTFSSSTGSYNEVSGIWTIGNLENGDVETLLIDVEVKPTGDYLNTVEITASNIVDSDSTPGNGDITEDDYAMAFTTPIRSVADLSISKTTVGGIFNAQPGDALRFQITVDNAGPENATNVKVLDQLPPGFEYVRFSTTAGIYDNVTGIWDLGGVPASGSQTLFVDVIVQEATDTAGEFINRAEITASDQVDPNSNPLENASIDDLADGIPDNDEVELQIVVEVADLSLTKTISDPTPNVGEIVTFTLQISNAGPDVATGVSIQDILPIGYSSISTISDLGAAVGNTIDWNNLRIPLTGLEITYQATVNAPELVVDEYKNIAQITASNQFDPNSTPGNDNGDQSENDEDNLTIPTPGVDVAIMKTVDNTSPAILDEIKFTITATNQGSLNATTVEVLDVLPKGYTFKSATVSSGVYDINTGIWSVPTIVMNSSETLVMTVTVEDVEDYLNMASLISLDQIDGDSTNDTATATIAPVCITVYNEFSPNDDGDNDTFYIDCISRYPNNELIIYNRWGNIVYSKKGYDNTFEGTSNGRATIYREQKLPVGTYYYTLDLGDGSNPKAGWLYINR